MTQSLLTFCSLLDYENLCYLGVFFLGGEGAGKKTMIIVNPRKTGFAFMSIVELRMGGGVNGVVWQGEEAKNCYDY